MLNKKQTRLRRSKKTRAKIKVLGKLRLSVFRTPRHIYAQIIDDKSGTTKTSASSVEKSFHGKKMGNVEGAKIIGQLVAERAKAANIDSVVFDRSGYKFHGRVQALAEAAREAGLQF
ncbi:MAG: 50S ribosomal protein L18 [Pseudomonadota bacterium]